MSIKEKEFKKAIQSAKAEIQRGDVEIGLRKLGDAHIKHLKYKHGLYSKNAIKDIEKSILRKYSDTKVPPELHKLFLEVSRYYSKNEMFGAAETTLEKILDSRNFSIMIQAQYEKNLIQLKRGLDNGEVNPEIIDDIKDTVKKDTENENETERTGELSDFDIFRSYFGDRIPVKDISSEIFPANMRKPRKPRNNVEPIDPVPVPNNGQYDENLSANNRLKFLMENFDIEFASTGYGKFTGAIMFEIRNSNLVIVENFWKKGKNGEPPLEDYGKATYILPKDSAMDLIELGRGQIKARRESDKSIPPPTSHTLNYYQTLIDRFNEAQDAQFKKIDPQYIPTGDEPSKVPEEETPKPENIDPEEHEEPVPETPKVSNEEFLNSLNENIGGLINPVMMDEFLKRTGYSLYDLYNKRLKDDIIEILKIEDTPEETIETEAQKVFIYIRTAKSMSLINSYAINGEKLSEELVKSVIEYKKAMEFLELNKGDGLSFRELRNQIREYVEIEPIPKPEPELKENQENVTPAIVPEEPTPVVEDEESQQGEDKLDTLFNGIKLPKEVKLGAMNLITRYLELLARVEELDLENERLDQQLAEKLEQQEMRKQETLKAQEQERLARLATETAIEQENVANKQVEETQGEKERIQKEREELKKKLASIQEALR